LLLDAGRPLSRSEIFEAIAAYRTGNPSAGERKFERDKKELRELGVPLEETDPDEHTYAIDREAYELPPVQLDEEERSALLLAAEAVRGTEGLVYRELIDEALRKLSFERPAGTTELPANLAVTLPPRRRGRGPRKLLADLTRAAETQKRVHMTYVSDRGDLTERAVDPYALLFRDGEWSLVGHCHLRGDQRTFRVDRIRGLKVAPRPATPDFVRPADWSLAQVLRRSPWVFLAGVSQKLDVVMDVGPDRAWIADEPFGEDARRERLPGGWVRVSFRSGNPDYVVTRVLDAGGQLRLVHPAELRDRVLRICEEVLARCAPRGAGS
jgi:predicted DNA-binding transcriptional regulator YafY